MAELQARWHQSMADFSEAEWDRLLGDGEDGAPSSPALPFFRWRWLHRLETSGSIVPRQGWQSCHLGLWRGATLTSSERRLRSTFVNIGLVIFTAFFMIPITLITTRALIRLFNHLYFLFY